MLRGGLMAAVLTVASPAQPVLAADAVGVRTISAAAPERDGPLTVAVWYPAGAGGTTENVGKNAVFEGVAARRDADIADGVFPVVLLAHGGLRAAPNQSGWIVSALAARGAIVAVVPPAKLSGAQAAVAETWLRPSDLTAALSALASDPVTAAHVAPEPAAVVGFFLGGTAGLSLAGARLDPARYAMTCDPPAAGPDCAWFADAGVDLRAVDPALLGRSGHDPRIGTVVAIDPELTSSLAADSLAGITAKVVVLNLGEPGTIAPYLDASGLPASLPGATYATLEGATPFSAMAACTTKGAAILAAEGEDDAICGEPGAARERTHERLAGMIAEALGTP